MNIILGRERADELRDKFTVLELETFNHPDGMQIPAYCVIPADRIPLGELALTKQWADLHGNLIREYAAGNANFCRDAIEHLMGKFGGELDTFYDHILSNLK